jgi:2-C-methyl-D-erythritol 2,4-cyclodiphosphate synthase
MIRTGIGIDTHQLVEGRPLIIGGVTIDYPKGLSGHSDADVLLHAVMDALLGSVADGDIGSHFPDTDPAWKDADSMYLLRQIRHRLDRHSATIHHVDAMILAEAPKMRPYIDTMRQNIARMLLIEPNQVSVKATTFERMGALGRGEGIAVQAIATVETP